MLCLCAGASVNSRDFDGRTPAMRMLQVLVDYCGDQPFGDSLSCILQLLRNPETDFSIVDRHGRSTRDHVLRFRTRSVVRPYLMEVLDCEVRGGVV